MVTATRRSASGAIGRAGGLFLVATIFVGAAIRPSALGEAGHVAFDRPNHRKSSSIVY
jgi:hypothetical protein